MKKQINNENDIAIIGLGFRIPGDENNNGEANKLFENLKSGFDAISEINNNERWSKNYSILGEHDSNKAGLLNLDVWKNFDPLFFGINPSEVANIDPQQRLSLISTWEALEDAYLDPISLRGTNTSVFMGSFAMDYLYGIKDRNSREGTINSNFHCLANRISYCFDFRGQSVSVDTACSSSSNAIIAAIQTIISGASDISVCGGTNFIIDTLFSKSLTAAGMNSELGHSMSFDESADGYARSEGCGIIVLKSLSNAIKDGNKIYCVINGFSSNSDGNSIDKSNFFSPSINGQLINIENAFKSTNGTVLPSDIYYVEAHGTGTPVGDPIELEAISIALKTSTFKSSESPLYIGSLKSNIGHMEAASGVASLIKCCLLFKHRTLTPNINFNKPNPRINFKDWNMKVVTNVIPFPSLENQGYKPISIMINNFGATGSNTSFILSEYLNNTSSTIENAINNKHQYLIPFSSNSKKSLEQYQSLITNDFIEKMDFKEFLIKQIFTKTTQLGQRSVIISKSDWNGFKNQKYLTTSNKSSNIVTKLIEPTIVFVFPGQGPQFNKMAIELYENEIIFRETMDEIDNLFKLLSGHSILKELRNVKDNDTETIHKPSLGSSALIMVEIALFKLLKHHWNIEPSFIIGHSLGEIPAAYCSGMIDLETCIKIIYIRSKLQDTLIGTGQMLSITITKDEYNLNWLVKYPLIEIACFNSPTSIVVSGNEFDLVKLSNELKLKSIQNSFLQTKVPYHCSAQMKIKDDMISNIGEFNSNQPSIPIFSTLTGELFGNSSTTQPLFSVEYIFKSTSGAVNFEKAINNLYQYIESNNIGNGSVTFIEISPHPVLSYYLNQLIPQNSIYFSKDSISILQTLNRKKNDINEINKTVSQLYCQGCNVNFKNQFNNNINGIEIYNKYISSLFDLPRYQWDLQSYWFESDEIYKNRIEGPPITILGNSNDIASPILSRTTYIDVEKEPFQWLKGHVVKDNGRGNDLIIEYMEFNEPFILIKGKNLPLTTTIIETSPNQIKSLFHIKDQKSNKWIQTSNGNITLFKNNKNSLIEPINPISTSIEDLKKQHNFSYLLKSDFYYNIKRITSINYSCCFQRVEECWIGENYSTLTKVSTKQLLSKNDNEMFLNASIIDCCLHGLFLQVKDPCVLVFDRIENFKIYSSNIPLASSKLGHNDNDNEDETFIYVLSKAMKSNNKSNSFYGSITAFLENGLVLFESDNVVVSSLSPVTDSSLPIYPTDELYSFYLESKDSIIQNINSFQNVYTINKSGNNQIIDSIKDMDNYKIIISNLLFRNISARSNNITKELINNNSIDQLMATYFNESNSKYYRLLKFVFETLKSNKLEREFEINNINNDSLEFVLTKSTKIISKLLFPLKDDDPSIDTPQSLFENDFLYNIYSNSSNSIFFFKNNLIAISNVISLSIEPLLNERMVFRILEIGGGTGSLSIYVIQSIVDLLNQNANSKILIEYTFTDISSSFLQDAKIKLFNLVSSLTNCKDNISLLFTTFDLESSYSSQSFKPSYYDFVIFSNVLHVIKDIGFGLKQINQLMKPSGHLLFLESPPSIIADSIFGAFEQWWAFTDTHLRPDRCCINKENWVKLLSNFDFINTISANLNINQNSPFLIHSQKKPITFTPSIPFVSSEYNIIIYTSGLQDSSINNFINLISNQLFSKNNNNNNNIKIVSNVDEFKNQNIPNNEKSLIFFISTIVPLNINNFTEISTELYFIGKHLEENKKNDCKTLVVSTNSNSESTNYLNSAVLGVMKYYVGTPISIYSFDYDQESISNENTVLSTIDSILLNSKNHIQIEYIIRNHKVYFERIYNEKVSNNNINNNGKEMITKLNSILEYELHYKPNMKNDQIEIKVIATGINKKDNLNYLGLIPKELIYSNQQQQHDELGYGYEFSGIVTKIGKDVKSFKAGDSVIGLSQNSTSSHLIVDENSSCILLKPDTISHLDAASIAYVYLTSYYSLFKIGDLDLEGEDQSILIHNATSDIGLSALNILRWKGIKSNIFVTVDSIEKEQYLYEQFADFITGVYSNKNINYIEKIKLKLKQLGSNKYGVDLIINTLSSIEYSEINFKSVCIGGKIIDLSITHLEHSHFTNFKKFNRFISYQTFDLSYLPIKKLKLLFKEIIEAISNGELKLIKTNKFSVSNIKDAIQSYDKTIGKIVVEMDNHKINDLLNSKSIVPEINKSNYKLNCNLGKTILITGQTGIVFDILKWIVSNSENVENIIIFSYSKIKWELKLLINQTMSKSDKIKFYFKSVDVSNEKLLYQAINEIYDQDKQLPKVESIFHFAFEQVIKKMDEIDLADFKKSHAAKTLGTIYLHTISLERGWDLKNFVLSSSIASVMFQSGSPSYISSNNVLDAFSRYRKSIGLKCTTVNIGMITSTGKLGTGNKSTVDILESIGMKPIKTSLLFGVFDLILDNGSLTNSLDNDKIQSPVNYNNMVCGFNLKNAIPFLKGIKFSYKFDYLTNQEVEQPSSTSNTNNDKDSMEGITEFIINTISDLLSIEPSMLNVDFKMSEYGADSLHSTMLKSSVEKQFSLNVLTISQIQSMKIKSIIQTVFKLVNEGKQKQKINESVIKNDVQFWENECKFIELNQYKEYTTNAILEPMESLNNQHIVLLTGVTGFFGIYLLYHIIQFENCPIVYCTVRNKENETDALQSIINNLNYHKLYDSLNQEQLNKINVLMVSDLSDNNFGLSNEINYQTLSESINLIIHCAANISVTIDYEESKQTNIGSLKQLIKFAFNKQIKRFVNFSTMALFFYDQTLTSDFDESKWPSLSLMDKKDFGGYRQCKVIGEYLLKYAFKNGLPTILIRLPSIFSNSITGIGSKNDMFLLLLQSCFAEKCYFNLPNSYFIPTPVDVSKSTISLIFNNSSWVSNHQNSNSETLTVYNLYSDSITFSSIFEMIGLPKSCELEYDVWESKIRNSKNDRCIRYHTFCPLKFPTIANIKLSEKTKSILSNNNNHTIKISDGNLKKSMIENHLNFIFKK